MRLIYVLVTLAFVFRVQAQQEDFVKQLPVFKGQKIVSRGVFRDKVPSFQELQAQASRFQDYDSFLKVLFTEAPSLRQNFVLVHNSESQQLSSLEHPRVLLFGGGMAFGLSESPDQKDRRVEIMQVDPKNYEVSLHEIVFYKDGPEFVEKPQSCTACHGSPAKPLWNPYDFWPNAFGSAIGFVGTKQETAAYQKILDGRKKSVLMSELRMSSKITQDTEDITAFTQYIHQINLGRWSFENLKPSSGIDEFAEPLIAALSYCAGDNNVASEKRLREFFHPADVALLPKNYKEIHMDLKNSRTHFKKYLDEMQKRIFPNGDVIFKVDHSRLAEELGILTQIRYIFEMAGVDASNLSTSLVGNDSLISAPSNAPLDFVGSFFEARPDLFKGVKWEASEVRPNQTSWIKADCNSLKASSRKKRRHFASEKKWPTFNEIANARPVISRCSKCHVEGLNAEIVPAPRIAFGRPQDLATALRKPELRLKDRIIARVREGRGTLSQMPPGKALTDAEVEALSAYLENLSL